MDIGFSGEVRELMSENSDPKGDWEFIREHTLVTYMDRNSEKYQEADAGYAAVRNGAYWNTDRI